MKVLILKNCYSVSKQKNFKAGQEAEVSKDLADIYIKAGIAKKIGAKEDKKHPITKN